MSLLNEILMLHQAPIISSAVWIMVTISVRTLSLNCVILYPNTAYRISITMYCYPCTAKEVIM